MQRLHKIGLNFFSKLSFEGIYSESKLRIELINYN